MQEQARLRDNLARVPANSDLQRRYLATLDKQETELEAIAKRRADAEKGVETAREALRSYVARSGSWLGLSPGRASVPLDAASSRRKR